MSYPHLFVVILMGCDDARVKGRLLKSVVNMSPNSELLQLIISQLSIG